MNPFGDDIVNKKMHISKCNENYVLAEDIVNDCGAFILPCGTILNDYIIKKLAEFGIEYVIVEYKGNNNISYLNYHIFEKKHEDIVNKMKCFTRSIIRGKRIEYSEINEMANSIISECKKPEYILKTLNKLRDADDYTYYHSVNVSFYAMLLGGWLNLARNDIKIIIQAALMHDIGKTKIPNELLNKKGVLSIKEFEEIRRHAIYGYEMVRNNPEIPEDVKDVILMHHEREDRSGYPLQASDYDLSIYTKIVSVADVYEAMTSNRPYKKALTPFEAFEEFHITCRGRLNMQLVNTLLYNLSRYYIGSTVVLNTGQLANIAYIPPQCIWKPIIDMGSKFLDLSREEEVFITRMA